MLRRVVPLLLALGAACVVPAPFPIVVDDEAPGDAGPKPPRDDDAPPVVPTTPTPVAPGASCACDADCAAVDGHAGACVLGLCMTTPTADCASSGSTAECPAGFQCWGVRGADVDMCWPDCDAYACDGACDDDGSCTPIESLSQCDDSCAAHCDREVQASTPPPSELGAPPADLATACADVPSFVCDGDESYCGELIPFEPDTGDGWWDYPINGETETDEYRSWARRDLVLLVQYAAAVVRCTSQTWPFGNGAPLGLGDMSEEDGDIPGTRDGDPAHPYGSHTNGKDMDIAYYQLAADDNRLRPVCPHTSGGSDVYHCTGAPTDLDVWRSALFIAALHDSPQMRVLGVDGRIGPLVEDAIDELCASGWFAGGACSDLQLAYETSDTGSGWYRFHHHHLHVSLLSRLQAGLDAALVVPRGMDACLDEACAGRTAK